MADAPLTLIIFTLEISIANQLFGVDAVDADKYASPARSGQPTSCAGKVASDATAILPIYITIIFLFIVVIIIFILGFNKVSQYHKVLKHQITRLS